jgi:hypothetical protein
MVSPWETSNSSQWPRHGQFRLGPFLDLPQLALQENGLFGKSDRFFWVKSAGELGNPHVFHAYITS